MDFADEVNVLLLLGMRESAAMMEWSFMECMTSG